MNAPVGAPEISRRRIVQGVAWAAPAIVLAVGTPPAAASGGAGSNSRMSSAWVAVPNAASIYAPAGTPGATDIFYGASVAGGTYESTVYDNFFTGFYRKATFGAAHTWGQATYTFRGKKVEMIGDNSSFIGSDFRDTLAGRFVSWTNNKSGSAAAKVVAYYALDLPNTTDYRIGVNIGTGASYAIQTVDVDLVTSPSESATAVPNLARVATRSGGAAGYSVQAPGASFMGQTGTQYQAQVSLPAQTYYLRMVFTLAANYSGSNDDIWVSVPSVQRLAWYNAQGLEVA